jgi:hypothetical protein
MKRLAHGETLLCGKWIMKDGSLVSDNTNKRIEYLTQHILKHVATSDDGWDKLFINENDHRYWELLYPASELHGGGPPILQCLPAIEITKKYNI